jgi:RsiW-degrading membrane proteinase PrsW (M82 family)
MISYIKISPLLLVCSWRITEDNIKPTAVFCFLMVLNATFNNIFVILWQSVLLVEETRGPREKREDSNSQHKW